MKEINNFLEDCKIFYKIHNQSKLAFLYYPDIRVVFLYRLSRILYSTKILRPFSYLLTNLNDILHGVWIGPKVKIGKGVSLGHPRGLIINPNTVIGNYCSILQRVTLGGPNIIIQDFVEINANVTIISKKEPNKLLIINEGATIGAGSVVTKSIDPYTIVVGNPSRVLKIKQRNETWLTTIQY